LLMLEGWSLRVGRGAVAGSDFILRDPSERDSQQQRLLHQISVGDTTMEAEPAEGGFAARPVDVGKSPGPLGACVQTVCCPVKQEAS
jgi:hypothetical protein